MFSQYFGQFLLNRGLVSTGQLEQAAALQKETRVKLGVMAINYGYMTAGQVETVHQLQMKLDKRFGEIAVELGFISEELVGSLLSSQQSAHLALGQALIDQGVMTYDSFAGALQQYKREYSLSDDQFEAILNGSIEQLLEAVLLNGGLSDSRALADYISLFGKNLIRFIDSGIRLEWSEPDPFASYDWIAEQHLLSPDRYTSRFTALAGSEASMLELASKYAQEPVEAPGEMMEASVGEFLNLHNGIYLVNLSNRHIELELAPQQVIRGTAFQLSSPVKAAVKIIGANWSFELIIGDLEELI